MLLTVISIDRYFAMVRPLHKVFLRKPRVMICMAWFISIIQFLPTFHFSKVVNIVRRNQTIGYCTPIPYNTTSGYGFLLFVAIFSFVLPLATISLMYGLIIRVVWFRHQHLNQTMSNTNRNSGEQLFRKSKKKVLRMLMIVVVAFICCWLPFVIYCGFIEVNIATFPNPVDIIRIATYCLALFNSILNPFIYFFSNTLLRKACTDLICCRKFTMPSSSNLSGSPGLPKKLSSVKLSFSPNLNTYLSDRRAGRHSVHSMLLAKADVSKEPSPLARTRRLHNGLGASLRRQGSLPIIAMSDSPWMRRAADNRLATGVENVGRMPKQLPKRTTMEEREKTTFI